MKKTFIIFLIAKIMFSAISCTSTQQLKDNLDLSRTGPVWDYSTLKNKYQKRVISKSIKPYLVDEFVLKASNASRVFESFFNSNGIPDRIYPLPFSLLCYYQKSDKYFKLGILFDVEKLEISNVPQEFLHFSENKQFTNPDLPKWRTEVRTDEMTNEKYALAISPDSYPTRRLAFPYQNLHSNIIVRCTRNGVSVFFLYSSEPNLNFSYISSGYSYISSRLKWDHLITDIRLSQKWGSKWLSLANYENDLAISDKIRSNESAMLELDWYGEGLVRFKYSLNGADEAIKNCFRSL